jgi:lysophospholipase L1-like esterase
MVASGGWTAQTYQQLPIAFIGKSAAHDKAIVVHGDSISEGTGDAPFAANLGAMGGYIQRGLWSVNGRAFPHINLSRGGTRGVQLAVNFVKRRAMNKYVTHAIVAEGTNDAAVASWSEVAQAYRIICRTLEYDGVLNAYANQL